MKLDIFVLLFCYIESIAWGCNSVVLVFFTRTI